MIYLSLVVPEGTVISTPLIALLTKVMEGYSPHLIYKFDDLKRTGSIPKTWVLRNHGSTPHGKVEDHNPICFAIVMEHEDGMVGTVVALDEGGVLAMGSRMPLPADASIEFSNPPVVHFTNDEDSILFELSK